MGKILISNNKEWNESLRNIFGNNGLKQSYHDNLVTVYKKRFVECNNIYLSGNDYLILTGTWAYNNLPRKKQLEMMFAELKRGKDIKALRNEIIGTFALVVKLGEEIMVCVDANHTYALYYYIDDNNFLISNTYYHLEIMAKQELDVRVFSTQLAKNGLNSNRTPFKNIYRLFENTIIKYDIDTNTTSTISSDYSEDIYNIKDEKEAVDILSKSTEGIYSLLNKNINSNFIFLTGGVDSRLMLSLDLYFDKKVRIGYWKGSDSLTNGTIEDEKVNKLVANAFNIKTSIFDVSMPFQECLNNISIEKCNRYGEYVSIYGNNEKWFNIFKELSSMGVEKIDFGYTPDILKGIDSLDSTYVFPYNTMKLSQDVCLRSGIFKEALQFDDIANLIKEDVEMSPMYDSEEKIDLAKASLIFNYSRLDMGVALCNFVNEYFYSYPLFYEKKIWDIVSSIPYEYKKKGIISSMLIEKWNEKLLDIPIYSQRHYLKYDKNSHILKSNALYSFMKRLQPYIINTKLYDLLFTKVLEPLLYAHNKGNDKLLTICNTELDKSPSFRHTSINIRRNVKPKGFDLAGYCELVAKCKCMDDILCQM